MIRHTLAALLLGVLLADLAAAQDVVRLRNGRYVSGTVVIDEADKEGFKVERWDTGATVFIRWTQIHEGERNRLLNKPTQVAGPVGNVIDGVRILTNSREVIGVFVKEDASNVEVKTASSPTPVTIPKNAILRRDERQIRESEAYNNDEMIDSRGTKVQEGDAEGFLTVARFCHSLQKFSRAKEFYEKALAAAPDRKEEIEGLLAANELLIKEEQARALIAAIRKLTEDTEYAKAVEEAGRLQQEFADTETARENANLVTAIEAEKKEFETKRAEYLAAKIPDFFRAKRSGLIARLAARTKIEEARAEIPKIDEQVVAYLAEKYKATDDEIDAAWSKREEKKRIVGYGSGTWIVKGGQDGGLDTNEKIQPVQQNQNSGSGVIDSRGRLRQSGNRNRTRQKPKPIVVGRKLDTAQDWWARSSRSERRGWIEAEYASSSSKVNKEVNEEAKECRGPCRGTGNYDSVRYGKSFEVLCPRCHGAKFDVTVTYW